MSNGSANFDSKLIMRQISTLYELALSVGNSLDTKENCAAFFKTLMSRKGFGFAAVWVYNRYLPGSEDSDGATLVYAMPEYHIAADKLPLSHPIFACNNGMSISSADPFFTHYITEKNITKGTIIIIPLGHLGIVKLFSISENYVFDQIESRQLNGIFSKFAISLEGCFNHQRLAIEIEDRKKVECELNKAHNDLEQRVEERTHELSVLNQKLTAQIEQNYKTEAALRQQNDYLSHLHTTTLGLMNQLDVKDLLKSITASAGQLVGTDHGFIYLLNNETGIFERKLGLGIFSNDIGRQIPKEQGLTGLVYLQQSPVVVDDYSIFSNAILPPSMRAKLGALMEIPLKGKDGVIGTIGLAFTEKTRKYTAAEVELVSRFAELASIALVNAKLHTAVQEELQERIKIQRRLEYVSLHDALTGLYNRHYFEQALQQLQDPCYAPVGIIVCDVDGLKVINDSLGHDNGDLLLKAVASLLSKTLTTPNIVARIGGDEFAVILPNTTKPGVEFLVGVIGNSITDYNTSHPEFPIYLSAGCAVSTTTLPNIMDVFKEADNNMYREKLQRNNSVHGSLVQALTKALEARDFITQGHAERMQNIVERLARKLGISEYGIGQLKLFTQFHDIGKISISDLILFKAGPLTQDERLEMQRHSELGFRIAQSIPEIHHIADFILKHHEWWNGQGYPLGLKGEEIPLECRIVALADAYDAMTNNRPYRKALTKEQAVAELLTFKNIQFDPVLVDLFIEALDEDQEEHH